MRLTLSIDDEIVTRLSRAASSTGRPVSAIVEEAVKDYFVKNPPPVPPVRKV
jgi:predicted transcriptional regulator